MGDSTTVYEFAADAGIARLAPAGTGDPDGVGGHVVFRHSARWLPQRIDHEAADLLSRFTVPRTADEVISAYCHDRGEQAAAVVDDARQVVAVMVGRGVLVAQGQSGSPPAVGWASGYRTLRCVRSTDDAEVWEATGPDGEHVALKIAAGDDDVAMLHQEAMILPRLNGVAVPRLVEWRPGPDLCLLATQWTQGISPDAAAAPLIDQARAGSAAAFTALLDLALSILDAYIALHAADVVHGDVHQGNILVAGTTATLVDFGQARPWLPPMLVPTRRVEPGYAEPEFATAMLHRHPSPHPSAASDQYSLATLLYGLFTGSRYLPHTTNLRDWLHRVAHQPPDPLPDWTRRHHPALETVLHRALAKNPTDRYPTLAQLRHDLVAARPVHDSAPQVRCW
ncbi:protein kinase [Lentzea sp. BCCO 10_0856]|uniref:non-specific serine/threonine protein kinase n=1 Tax=Lentzea miocenica TaxID=3095431 RepID=A0ABU4TF07_9PSEU|nr:protein kinase [Lentzea sp. BCCO 10_0856]MDX8036753.1 protein kinase [Lentzea sp. BCCO 10_0856]